MRLKTSRDMPGAKPRKGEGKEKQDASVTKLDKTNDWDRDQVHGNGDTIGIASKPSEDDAEA
ncbi:hypothetical protein [Mesorhizobium sp. INR15]|uniref:hypothetical protein n=1 Tax=Mesorhizobium sp. INR15 TaxID=2654248 RepID=UPI001896893C|nr:hypothetical protein [Mesorhizobium sp. INR15]QPC91583.1 hypothetical protein GA829_13750 [Mesorhizobium sp. INR15]